MKKLTKFGVLMFALVAGVAAPLSAQPALPTTTNGMGGTNQWMQMREQMRAMREQRRAEIQAQDQELQQLATQMTNAPAGQKTDAIAAVVGKLVEDRLAQHQEMEAMHGMGGHMKMGGTNGAAGQGAGGGQSTQPPQ